MKKIITLIMMFVLSVGFLMAQGVFTYQTVVVDNQGNLVVNKEVTANVTITDGTNTFTQTNLTGTTSNNGLLILSVGDKTNDDFKNMKWENAKIQVEYPTVEGTTVETDNYSQIPVVPYALQSDAELNTQMIVDYISTATMDDVDTILKAMEHPTPNTLKDSILNAIVDSVKANYQLSKEVVMDYLSHLTKGDVAKLYDSLMRNDELVQDITDTMVKFLQDSTEMVYDILREYALSLTKTDVNGILNAIPDDVKTSILDKVVGFLETDDAKAMLIPVLINYLNDVTVPEVERLNQAVHANPNGAYDSLIACFNKWMDEYFANYFTGTGNVQATVDQVMDSIYYSCQTDINLCQLKHDLDSINAASTVTCFTFVPSSFTVTMQPSGTSRNFVGTAGYNGPVNDLTEAQLLVSGDVDVPNEGVISINNTITLDLADIINTNNKTVNFTISENDVLGIVNGYIDDPDDYIVELPDGTELNFIIIISRACSVDVNAEIAGSYTIQNN